MTYIVFVGVLGKVSHCAQEDGYIAYALQQMQEPRALRDSHLNCTWVVVEIMTPFGYPKYECRIIMGIIILTTTHMVGRQCQEPLHLRPGEKARGAA